MPKQSPQKILVTGGAGFIGSAFVRHVANKSFKVHVIDKLTYAGDKTRLKEVRTNISFHKIDITKKQPLFNAIKKIKPDIIVHFAAETHVDRSLVNVEPFIQTNILGTQNLIDAARAVNIRKFLHISTDEVYGESRKGRFKETAPLNPGNPYAATKTAADMLVLSAIRNNKLKAIIIRPCNCFGPWQHPEKFIPKIISQASSNKKIPVYGKGQQIREWLYVDDCVLAIELLMHKGRRGQIYNISSYFEQTNITTSRRILKLMDKPQSLITFVKDRENHDFRYSIDSRKIRKLRWRPRTKFETGLEKTIHSRFID